MAILEKGEWDEVHAFPLVTWQKIEEKMTGSYSGDNNGSELNGPFIVVSIII